MSQGEKSQGEMSQGEMSVREKCLLALNRTHSCEIWVLGSIEPGFRSLQSRKLGSIDPKSQFCSLAHELSSKRSENLDLKNSFSDLSK